MPTDVATKKKAPKEKEDTKKGVDPAEPDADDKGAGGPLYKRMKRKGIAQ